jgi:hypothetical protein
MRATVNLKYLVNGIMGASKVDFGFRGQGLIKQTLSRTVAVHKSLRAAFDLPGSRYMGDV